MKDYARIRFKKHKGCEDSFLIAFSENFLWDAYLDPIFHSLTKRRALVVLCLMDTYHWKYITSNSTLLYPLVKRRSKPNVENVKWGLMIACKWVFDIRFQCFVYLGVHSCRKLNIDFLMLSIISDKCPTIFWILGSRHWGHTHLPFSDPFNMLQLFLFLVNHLVDEAGNSLLLLFLPGAVQLFVLVDLFKSKASS